MRFASMAPETTTPRRGLGAIRSPRNSLGVPLGMLEAGHHLPHGPN